MIRLHICGPPAYSFYSRTGRARAALQRAVEPVDPLLQQCASLRRARLHAATRYGHFVMEREPSTIGGRAARDANASISAVAHVLSAFKTTLAERNIYCCAWYICARPL